MSEEDELQSGVLHFETEGRLLQELGERLVGKPEVAVVELLKNSYDADATVCTISTEHRDTLLLSDNGSGMTLEQFKARWMRIATAHKATEPVSERFGRRRTGQKGIGRFAVRFLGRHLKLTSIAFDSALGVNTCLVADFAWAKIDRAKQITSAEIPYTLTTTHDGRPTGVQLKISGLRQPLEFLSSKSFTTDIIKIISPLESLSRGPFSKKPNGGQEVDSGFSVNLAAAADSKDTTDNDLADAVLSRAWARLTISVTPSRVRYRVESEQGGMKEPAELDLAMKTQLHSGAHADIRFFPKRAGVFRGASFDGRTGWHWVRSNCGVAVVDHGFRMRPYGFPEDDWLRLDFDGVHNTRNWRSTIANEHFPIPPEAAGRPGQNPALNIPNKFQVVGAVFVESRATSRSKKDDDDVKGLVVAADREGFLDTEAFRQLVDIVRGGIEFMAFIDKQNVERLAEIAAQKAAAAVRQDFAGAIAHIRDSETLTAADKSRLVVHYSALAKKLEDVEEYGRESRRKLELMALLGVVAGFMTHEAARILDGLESALKAIRALKSRDPNVAKALSAVQSGYNSFKGQVEYTSVFVDSLHRDPPSAFKVRPQIDRILERFGAFAHERAIVCANDVEGDVDVRGIPVAAYSGVVLNLYTNALKAVIAREERADSPHVAIRSWNEEGLHVVEVSDKGIGVPAELSNRIFDPLFTTTSNVGNPLGSGMGLGLGLIRDVVHQYRGRVMLQPPPPPFTTCFRVELPQ